MEPALSPDAHAPVPARRGAMRQLGVGLGHRGSDDVLTNGNESAKHGRVGIDSQFSRDDH
jgi:hypothetical protein